MKQTTKPRKSRAQTEQANHTPAASVADAIDLVHSVRFVAGISPDGRTRTEPEAEAIVAAHSLASHAKSALEMRTFQKAGISSRYVAQCLREGVLVAVREASR